MKTILEIAGHHWPCKPSSWKVGLCRSSLKMSPNSAKSCKPSSWKVGCEGGLVGVVGACVAGAVGVMCCFVGVAGAVGVVGAVSVVSKEPRTRKPYHVLPKGLRHGC